MQKFLSLLALPALFSIAACSDDSTPGGYTGGEGSVTLEPGKTWALHPDAIRLSEEVLANVTVVGNRIVLPLAQLASIGSIVDGKTILISAGNPFAPEKNPGFMRKLLSREVKGDTVEFVTKDLGIEEVIRGNLSSAIDKPVFRAFNDGSGLKPVVTKAGLGLQNEGDTRYGLAFDVSPEVKLTFQKYYPFFVKSDGQKVYTSGTGWDPYIAIRPELHIEPFIDFNLDIGLHIDWFNTNVRINSARVGLGVAYDAKVAIEAKLGSVISGGYDNVLIPGQNLGMVMIGPIPFWVTISADLHCTYDVSGGVSLRTIDPYHFYGTPELGMKYDANGGWSPIETSWFAADGGTWNTSTPENWYPDNSGPSGQGLPLKIEGGVRCSVGPRLQLTAGVSMNILGQDITTGVGLYARPAIGGGMRAAACYNFVPTDGVNPPKITDFTYGYKAGLFAEAVAGASANFLGNNIASAEAQIFKQEFPFVAGGSSTCLPGDL